jgi:hypothetical protein
MLQEFLNQNKKAKREENRIHKRITLKLGCIERITRIIKKAYILLLNKQYNLKNNE